MRTVASRTDLLYFAFGSNLDLDQMRSRCPQSRPLRAVWLADHRLIFCGVSQRWGGCGVASIVPALGMRVFGRLYRLTVEDAALLDGFENVPQTYVRQACELYPFLPTAGADAARGDVGSSRAGRGHIRPDHTGSDHARRDDVARTWRGFTYVHQQSQQRRGPALRYFHQIWQGYRTLGLPQEGLSRAVSESLEAVA